MERLIRSISMAAAPWHINPAASQPLVCRISSRASLPQDVRGFVQKDLEQPSLGPSRYVRVPAFARFEVTSGHLAKASGLNREP